MPYAIEPLHALFGALLQKFWISDAYAKYLVIFCHNVKMLDPFTVTSQTIAVNFNLVLTNYGAQFVDGNNVAGAPEEFGSAPFAGYFTVLNAD